MARRQILGHGAGAARRALIWLVVAALLLPGWLLGAAQAGAQGGSQVLIWYNGADFTAFGGNETIAISVGSFEYVTECGPLGGIPDNSGFRTADVYIIPSGEVPTEFGPLTDVGGSANTIAGTGTAFTDRVIGFAKPQGQIPPGRYAVVYDECQNGVLDAYDAVFHPAFEVIIDPNVPPLPNAEMAAIKGRAANQRDHWKATTAAMLGAFAAADFLDAFGAVDARSNPLASAYWFAQTAGVVAFNKAGYNDPKDSAITNAINTTRQYAALAADPPDPNFAAPVALSERIALDPQSSDPLTVALVRLGDTLATDEAQLAALLAALEKYQGAGEAGTGEGRGIWAAAHARAIQTYAAGQSDHLAETDAALAALANALAADTRPIDSIAADLEARRAAIVAGGFSDDELKALRALGLTDGQINQARADLADTSFAGTEADLVAGINAVRGEIAATQTALDNLAGAMEPIIAELDVAGTDDHPVVNAGGPYAGTVGAAVAFSGSATAPPTIVTYAWDLDGDGDFDDATGTTTSRTYDRPMRGLVGLRATNVFGRVGIAYAPLIVTGGNGRPQITAVSPILSPTLISGSSQLFDVTTNDPDGDGVTVTWTLDGATVGTGASYTLAATPFNLGPHTLIATVSDGKPLGTVTRLWEVLIVAPDADADGWRANVDCDDSDPQAGYCPAQILPPDPANALTVTSTGNGASCPDGPGQPGYTLRCAINAANAAGSGKTIAFNIPASDPGCDAGGVCTIALVANEAALPALTANGTAIDGYTQPGATPNTNEPGEGTNAAIKIHLKGDRNATGHLAGLNIVGSGNVVRGLAFTYYAFNTVPVTRFGAGIYISGSNNRVVGNYIGPNPDATRPDRPNRSGVEIIGNSNVVGGPTPAELNLISGNGSNGVDIHNTNGSSGPYPTGNVIIGNLIGTDPSGTTAFGNSPVNNQNVGVRLSTTRGTIVGGTTPAERNIISGNRAMGLDIGDGADDLIVGNYIGPDRSGALPIGNSVPSGGSGSDCCGIRTGTINSRLTIKQNVISANGDGRFGAGVSLDRCYTCRIIGNKIGTNAAGTAAMGNSEEGLRIFAGNDLVIGGTEPGEGNIISGNGRNAIWLSAEGGGYSSNNTRIVGNLIGTDASGTGAIGNGGFGVWTYTNSHFAGESVATIGGVGPGEANVIAHNTLGGLGIGDVLPGWDPNRGKLSRDLIRGNVIRNNGGLGIDLQPENAVNCAEATSDGPNAYIHCPVIRAVTPSAVSGTGPAGATIDVYLVGAAGDGSSHGEANAYLGSATVRGCGNTWTLAGLDLPAGAVVTATASNLSGPSRGTSEFAANVARGTGDPAFAPAVTPGANQQATVGLPATIDLGAFAEPCPVGPWQVSVDWGDASAPTIFTADTPGALGTRTHTYNSGGTKTVTVTVTNSVDGDTSASFTVAVPTSTPGAPRNIAATPGNTAATITWHAPASDGGSPIDRYDVSIAPTAGGTPQTRQITNLANLTTTFTGLTNGTAYTARVTAHNSNGSGPETTVTVTPVAPTIVVAGLNPATLPEGSAAFTLTVSGSGFAEGMEVRWNGGGRTTTFVSVTALSAQIAVADVADSGTASVTVHDPTSNTTSDAAALTITNVAPTATFVAPPTVSVGSPIALSLTGPSDPSPADTSVGFGYAFDCGTGSGYGPFGATNGASCPTSATGSRAVKGKVRDADGGEREYTATVQIVALPAAALGVAAADGPYGGAATLSATLSLAGQPLAGKTIAFAVNGAAAGSATTDGGGVATIASASLVGIAAGSYPGGVTATYAGEDGQHTGAVGSGDLTVAKASQTITFAPLADRQLGSAPFTVSAVASSGLAVTFAASGGCTVSGATVTVGAVGTCTITASQAGDANHLAAPAVARSFQVTAVPVPTPSSSPSPIPSPSPSPSAAPTVTLTLRTEGEGNVAHAAGGASALATTMAIPYPAGTRVSLTPQPAGGHLFVGWSVDGAAKGWASPLTITMDGDHTVVARFVPTPTLPDVAPGEEYGPAILELRARGTMRGYEDGTFGPEDRTKRAQMAALIARAMGYADGPANPFTDRCDPADPGNCVDDELWQRVAQLAGRNVARGYTDPATCAPAGTPCYAPRDEVLHAQVLSFITRAMVDAGHWTLRPIDPALYGGVLNDTGHEADVATYLFYTQGHGGVPDYPAGGPFAAWDQPSTRGWFARALWAALDSHFGADEPGKGGYVP